MAVFPDHRACSVEVLIVPGCTGAKVALTRVQEAAESLGVETSLRVLTVDREDQALALGFLGSPTIRVEGLSVGLSCRLYAGDVAPPVTSIRRALMVACSTPSA